MRRLSIVSMLALSLLPVADAGAQIIRSGRFGLREPQLWVSGGAALQQGWSVTDGASGARWDFSDGLQFGAAVERTINGGTSVGIRGTTARVPLNYIATTPGGGSTEADAQVSQAYAGIRVSSGRGFHTVLELGAGATFYHNFRSRGGVTLPPESVDADFTFVFGYGFGYSVSRNFQVDVVQDLATALHQKAGLAAGERSSARISSTRLVARYGLGS